MARPVARPDSDYDHLQRVNAVLRAIRNVSQLIVREKNPGQLISETCRLLVEGRGYHSSWIALYDAGDGIGPVAQCGHSKGFERLEQSLRRGELPACARGALAVPGAHIIRDSLLECAACPFTGGHTGRSIITVKLAHEGKLYGILGVSAPAEFTADEDETNLVCEVAGDIAYALHAIEEETLRTSAVEDLRRERDITAVLFDTSPVAIAVVEAGGGIVRANAEAERVLGLTRSAITQRTYDDPAWRIVGFDGNPFPVSELPVARVLREKRAVHGIEHVVQWPDGRRVLLSVNASPVSSAQGAITHVVCTMRDVTSERRMEAALRKSEHSYHALFEAMTSGFALHETIFDAAGRPADFRFLEVNPSFQRITGLKARDVVGRTLLAILPADERSWVKQYQQVVMSGVGATFEVHLERLGKDLRLIAYCPEPGRVAAVLEDITERKHAEVALRESEERYRALFEQSLNAIWLIAWDGPVMDVNKAFLRLFGYERADIASLTAQDLYEDPDERERTLQQILESGYVEGDVRLKRKDGTVLDCERHVVALRDRNGTIVALQGVARDISARKRAEAALRESEERYRSLFEQSLDAIWIGRPDGRGNVVNPAWLKMFGYEPDDMADFNAADAYVNPAERTDFLRNIAAHGTCTDEVRFRRKDGTEFDCERTAVALKDASGNIVRFQGVLRDITKEKQQKQALSVELARRRILLEQSRDGIVVLDEDGRAVETNRTFARMLGYAPEEVLQLHVWDWEAVASRETLEGMLRSVDETGDHFETRHRRKDGTVYDVEISTNGAVFGGRKLIFCVCRDVTERKRAEEALRHSEERNRSIVEVIPDLILRIDAEGTFLDVISSSGVPLAVPQERATGMGIEDVVSHQDAIRARAAIAETLRTGVVQELEYQLEMPGGKRWFEARFSPSAGEEVVALIRDVTERRQAEEALRASEERFRGVFENGPVGIAIVDTATFRILRANRAYQEIVGYSEDELKQMSVGDITPTEDWSRQQQFMEARFEAGYSGYTMEKHYIRKGGDIRDVIVVGELMRLGSDSPPLLIASVLDITNRKRVASELAESRENLRLLAQRVEQAREDERTAIARELHDRVGQTLTALKLDIDRLRRIIGRQQPDAKSLLDGMDGMVTAGADDVRRISSELRPGALDDLGLAGAIEWQLDEFRSRTGVVFTFSRDGEECDLDSPRSTALFRVFQELVTNVVRHADAHRVAVSLRFEAGKCVLTVADDGIGFDVEKANDRRSLGIAGMRERLLPYGGALRFESAPGKGTTARVTMPLR